MKIQLQQLNPTDFAPYGKILAYDSDQREDFQVIVQAEGSEGWRIAMMKVVNQPVGRISCHPNTMEAFEPVTGMCGILVARHDTPNELKAYLLDQAICVNKSVWHAVFSLSARSLVRVTENATVQSETVELNEQLCVGLSGL